MKCANHPVRSVAPKIIVFLVTAFAAKPSDPKIPDVYDEWQNDGDEDDYGEDSDAPEVPGSNVNVGPVWSSQQLPKIYTVGQTIVEDLNKSIQLPCNISGGKDTETFIKCRLLLFTLRYD